MFIKNSNIPYTELGGGVRRKILSYEKELMCVEVAFDKGGVGALHSHPHVQISYVIKGRFEATIGNETKIIGVGDTYSVAPDVVHGVTALEDGVLIDVFTPMREDFI